MSTPVIKKKFMRVNLNTNAFPALHVAIWQVKVLTAN